MESEGFEGRIKKTLRSRLDVSQKILASDENSVEVLNLVLMVCT